MKFKFKKIREIVKTIFYLKGRINFKNSYYCNDFYTPPSFIKQTSKKKKKNNITKEHINSNFF